MGLNNMEAVTQNKWLGHQNETDSFHLPYDIKIKKIPENHHSVD